MYEEAIKLLSSVINYDKDPTRLFHARYLLLLFYILKEEFAKAEALSEEFPTNHITKNDALIELYSEKKTTTRVLK